MRVPGTWRDERLALYFITEGLADDPRIRVRSTTVPEILAKGPHSFKSVSRKLTRKEIVAVIESVYALTGDTR